MENNFPGKSTESLQRTQTIFSTKIFFLQISFDKVYLTAINFLVDYFSGGNFSGKKLLQTPIVKIVFREWW